MICKRHSGSFCSQVSRYLHTSPALEEGQYWEFPRWVYMKHYMLEKQLVVPQVTKRAAIGEKSLQRSLVLKHCRSGLCPCHFPWHFLPVKTVLFIYVIYLLLQPSSLESPLQTKVCTLQQDTEAHPRPLGDAGRVCGRKGAALRGVPASAGLSCPLLAQPQAARWAREASRSRASQPGPAGLYWGHSLPEKLLRLGSIKVVYQLCLPASSGLHVFQHRACPGVSCTQTFGAVRRKTLSNSLG